MCSISGIINGDIKSLKKMIDVQSHRAPDESGYYTNKNIFIGMGRLKIIDLKSKIYVHTKIMKLYYLIMEKFTIIWN